jgi:hypothetical protein
MLILGMSVDWLRFEIVAGKLVLVMLLDKRMREMS